MNFGVQTREPSRSGRGAVSRFRLEQAVVLGFEAWWTGPHALIVEEHFASDAIFFNHCPLHLSSFAGAHVGQAAIVEGFRVFMAEFSVLDPCVTNILTDGFHVAVGYSVRLRHVGTGRSGRLAGMAHVRMDEDLKIKRVENYFDTACFAETGDMLELFAARSEAMDRIARRSKSVG